MCDSVDGCVGTDAGVNLQSSF